MDVLGRDQQGGVSRWIHPRDVVCDHLVLQDPKWTYCSLDQPGSSLGMQLLAANAPGRLWVPLLPGLIEKSVHAAGTTRWARPAPPGGSTAPTAAVGGSPRRSCGTRRPPARPGRP